MSAGAVLPTLALLANTANTISAVNNLTKALPMISSAMTSYFLPNSQTTGQSNPSQTTSQPGAVSQQPAQTTPNQQASNLCDYCQVQPKFFDGTRTHPFCSKSCAANAKLPNSKQGAGVNSQAKTSNCLTCHVAPQYSDGTKTYAYCSRRCASQARRASNKISKKSASSLVQQPPLKGTGSSCNVPGCQNPPYVDSHGILTEYCSQSHKRLAMEACLMCKKLPKKVGQFCTKACADDAKQKGPMILEVPEGHVTFKNVSEQFKASWRHVNKTCPKVRRVYKIVGTQASVDKYEAYLNSVEARGQFRSQGRSPGNENRRWHGTRRNCNFGDQGQTQFCSSTSCSLCCIVRTSYDLSLFGKKTGWGRFGMGIYTSSTSSKSDDYSQNMTQSTLKAILLNKVVVGKGSKMMQDNTTLTAPPAGYDSVLAEKGGTLNHDELVVYTNDAIRPSFLVMYDA
ncbi:ADP-ribosylation [Rickenella mellea]|uniref:ADP-ribosylation n=1 Tax=Rickenella mellea TaxID=50990 RepID=A0A4Y7QEW5_9AGAM|nr:ADP-ribosylation [Rickenella mellea]